MCDITKYINFLNTNRDIKAAEINIDGRFFLCREFLTATKVANNTARNLRYIRRVAIIVLHRHVNYTSEYKRQCDRQCRPALALWPGLRFCWLLCRPVKVKSLVCLNQCARKRPSYLCPVIMETSFASRTSNPISVISRPLSLWFLHPFGAPRLRSWKVVISRSCDVRSSPNAHKRKADETANNSRFNDVEFPHRVT